MGDIKKPKKRYSTSNHPWIRKEIEEYKVLRKEYGLKNRREILKSSSFLRKYKNTAKKLIASHTKQGDTEKSQMMGKLQKLGLITSSGSIDNILSLQVRDILNRRLESVVLRKGLAKTIKQARQFITHRHVSVGNKEVTSPSYLLTSEEENLVCFKSNSPFVSEDHPERVNKVTEEIKAEAEALRNYSKKNKSENEEKGPSVRESKEKNVKETKASVNHGGNKE